MPQPATQEKKEENTEREYISPTMPRALLEVGKSVLKDPTPKATPYTEASGPFGYLTGSAAKLEKEAAANIKKQKTVPPVTSFDDLITSNIKLADLNIPKNISGQ